MGRTKQASPHRERTQSHITEEILVREALALSLDQNDVIVRRRLAQKVRFLLEDNLEVPPPSEDELRAFFEENKEDYTIPATLSFDHIYFSDSAGGELASRIDLVAQSLADDPSQDWRALGDAFMLSRSFVRQPDYMIKRTFGGEFAERLLSLKLGGWEGPIQSGLGQHLVRINTKTEARSPAFEEIAERVTQHYINKARRDANVEQMERLRNQYTVFVEPKDDAGS